MGDIQILQHVTVFINPDIYKKKKKSLDSLNIDYIYMW